MTAERERPLTPMQQRFVEEYVVDLRPSAAAIRAGYSPRRVDAQANILLRDPRIAAAVRIAKEARTRAVNITAERVLEELAVVAFSDVADHIRQDKLGTKLKRLSDIPADVRRALESVTESRGPGGDRVAIKMHDKMKALDKLCAHLGICRNQLDLAGKVDGELVIKVVKL